MTAKKLLKIQRLSLDGTYSVEITRPAGRPTQLRIVKGKLKPKFINVHDSTIERLRELLARAGK